ncbi:hypothetical protein LTSEINV_5816 [Salmonella enterica subsp. enterica serovar Inverness str. R8-3668]|uniref:Uncharacterized protein n=1 Tax=Salmonella enterica subsp. enterica serovar Inverness str. R8-3668 TaxID=913075 RepID=G5NKX7_SALET|nr:hypothetical protein LTSEINV_5816 [Salmonella enterica subsp. enterica serovar Inverness str. R8-3668]
MTSADATIGLFGSKTPEAKTLPLKHRQHNTGKTFLVNNIFISPFDIIDRMNVY